MAKNYPQPNWKNRVKMDRYLESKGLLNYQTKGQSAEQVKANYQSAGIRLREGGQTGVNAVDNNVPAPTFNPQQPQRPRQGVPFNANPQGFTTQPNFGTPQNPTPAIPYEFAQNGLVVKVKLPQPVRTPGAFPTTEAAKNGNANWNDVSVSDRKTVLSDPNFYKENKIMQYPEWMRNDIIKDPSFDWDQLPKWQRPFYEASSRPAVAGAVQGLVMGLGNPGGAVAGGVLGAAAAATGYDQNKEAWQQGDNKFTWDLQQLKDAGKGAFGYLNLLAEFAEKTIGTTAQVINAASDPTKNVSDYLNKETFNANASFFEVIAPAIAAAQKGDGKLGIEDTARLLPALFEGGVILDLLRNPEKYKGEERYLGAAMPVELEKNWTERLDQARAEIASGRNYREVMSEMQTGIMAQVGDMAGQGVFDPLNVMPKAETGIVRRGAELSGNKVLAEAFTGVETPREGLQKFKNIVQTNEAVKVDPNFDARNLNGFEKMIAGLNRQGEIKAGGITNKGLLDPANPKKPAGGLFEETPQSRAQTGATMFDRNIGSLMTMFKDPAEAVGYIRRIAGGDMNVWKEMGSRVGNSPEWYTILPALKDFSAAKLEGLAKAWELTAVNRDALNRVADVLGDNPTQLIDDWASRNNTDQDFARIIQLAKEANTPESKALLADFEAGKFTPDTLKDIVGLFHGEGALPHTEAQWKWAMYADLSDHFAEWTAQHLLLDKSPEATSAFFQTMGVLKQAQSIILLGASPGYAIQNGLSGIVHLATDGIYGSMTPRQMDDWIARWETPIPRLDEGVGIGGMVDTVRGGAILDAVKPGKGPLTELKQTLSRIQRGMPMSKLSSKFESVNSKRGYITGLRKFWSQSWRRGVGFRAMEPALVKVLTDAGIEPTRIYAAIEAGANQKEIERALTGQYKGVQAQALINDAAQAAGVTHAQASDMLNKIGLTETLNTFLAGADTPDKVDAAFTRANQKMQDWIDMKYGEHLKTRAEEVKHIVGREGMAAGLNVAQQASNQFYDAWFDHYARFGDVMGGLEGLEPAQRSKVIDEAYKQSDANFRRVFASMGANYQGIFDVWGLSGDPDATAAVHAISDMNNSMKEAYDFMRQKRNDFSATLIREDRAPTGAELRELNTGIDKAFEKAFKAKHAAEVRMGEALKGVYTKLHGEAAGAAAKLWWNDVMKFSEKVVADEKKFRAEQEAARDMGASRADIADAKKKYYSENKQRWIADLQKINDEGIARLERIIKNKGGTATEPTAPTPAPTGPTQPGDAGTTAPTSAPKRQTKAQEKAIRQQEEINKLIADVKQIDAQEKRLRDAQVESVWNTAEGYWNRGGNYSRANLQDRFTLLNALKNPEYGGIPGLTGLFDPRLDGETVTRILDTRRAIKEAEKAAGEPPSIREIKKIKAKDSGNLNLLDAIRSYGGLNLAKITDYARDKKVGSMFGVFQKQAYGKGWDITDMAMKLVQDNFPIDLNDPNDPGGVMQTQALLDRALTGEKIYPTTHDYTANVEKINAEELAHVEALKADEAAFVVESFDAESWKARMQEAIATKDGDAVDTLFGELPEDLADSPHDADGETYAEYILRAQNNLEADAINDSRATSIATAKTEADAAVKASETRAEAVTTRTLMLESWTEIFGAEQAQTYMEMSDAVAQWYERTTGQSADEFYSRYYEDARRSAEADVIGELEQSYNRIEPSTRTMDETGAANFARMLVRAGEGELRSAIQQTGNKADRIMILNEAFKLNPDMAESVARAEFDTLRQAEGTGAKGAITFGADGIRATIHAFEAADFSTLIHENGHVFRRVMKDVAERTGNKQVVKDLATIEEWAHSEAVRIDKKIANKQTLTDYERLVSDGKPIGELVNGVWKSGHEEILARGFDKYIATGEAPTPKLRKAFDTFRGWMLQIYRTIKGSAIDVKVTDEVRGVFDRLLGAEQETDLSSRSAEVRQKAKQVLSPERLAEFEQIRKERMKLSAEMLDNGGAVISFFNGERNTLSPEQFAKYGSIDEIIKQAKQAQNNVVDSMIAADVANADMQTRPLGLNTPLYQRNKAQVSAAQFDMFATPLPLSTEASPQTESMFGGSGTVDTGTAGGLLPGMQGATGMMFDVQPGTGSLTKMDAGTARTIYDIDPSKTAGEFKAGDIVQDAEGRQHTVSGANMRSKIVTEKGRILDPKEVTRVAKQGDLFSLPPEPKPTALPEVVPAPGKLADFGEKLGGARKDKAQFVERNIADADIAKLSLTEIWPKAEVDKIEDVSMAAFSTILREEIPAKPRDSWKLKRWVEAVKTIRELVKHASENGVEATAAKMREYSSTMRDLQRLPDKMTILTQIPREKWSRIGKVENRPGAAIYKDGVYTPAPYAVAEVDGSLVRADTLEQLTTKITEKLNVEVSKASAMKFEIRGNGKQFFINKVGDPLYRKLITFESVEEARKYKRENAEALVQAWESVKESDNVKETDVRRAENRPRAGKDYRQGKDATPEMFNTFGFRGVEFGNWVSQGGNLKERQGMLNAAYDGLMDLADIVHIPPKALSLDGTLGLGLGSRGSGSASAHFEPGAIVINLTKTRGAGTLAHEWFHALDNYFSRRRGEQSFTGSQQKYREGNYITYKPEPLMVYDGSKYPMTEAELIRRREQNPKSDFYAEKHWTRDPQHPEGVRPEVEKKFTELVDALNKSPMKERAELIDKGKSGGYWSRIIERAARSFENYVIAKMAQGGYENDYLANVANLEQFNRDPSRYPYLTDAELAPVVEAFDNLFNTVKVDDTGTLYQRTDPFQSADLPIGSIEEAGQQPPHHEAMNEGYVDHIRPLMEAMQKVAREQVTNKPLDGAMRDLSPEGAAMLKKYRAQVSADMASTKNAATKWGEQSRDFAMLNYNKRYGIDRYLETVYPYQFFYTRSLATWAARALDKPAILSQYARIKRQQDRYERDIPERLRGKIKINLPWLPDWMGDALYIDPMRTLFTPLNYARPFERMMQDNSYQQIEAERILQEWASDGTVTASDITEAMRTREGKTWERAYAEAQIRRESEIQNPMDFMNTMLGPAWYLTTPYKLLTGKGAEVGSTPILNTTRAVDAVTQGTWAQPIGDLIGMIGKPEEMIRQKLNMPEFGEYGEYYVDRTLANMVADGILTSDQAQQAMIERKGAIFDQARERVKMELAMRVPTASALLAGLTADNFGQGIARMAMTAPVSLFGAGILPSGELEYRGLKQEWNEAWKRKDMGDDGAITQFFDDHPEYEAYLSKGKKPEERLRGYLVGQIWDGYMALGTTDRKQAGADMGEEFKRSFLDSETRSYETLSVDQLAQWAQMLNQNVPQTELTQPTLDNPAPQIDYFAPDITRITDGYFADRTEKFPNYYTEQTAYFNIPETDRSGRYKYLAAHPKLKEYWDWNKGWKTNYPELEPVFSGKVFKRIDTSGWPMGLSDYVLMYAYTGEQLPKGARKALEQEWLREGKPMDDLQSWLDGQVAPALLYGGQQ